MGQIDLVNHGCIAVLDLHDAVQFQHHHTWKRSGFEDHRMRNTTRDSVNQRQVPLVHVTHLSLEHRHVSRRGRVVKVDDEREGAVFVKEKRVVVVALDHVTDAVAVTINGGVNPPAFFLGLRIDGRHTHRSHRQRQHEKPKDGQDDEALRGRLAGHAIA